MTILQPIQAQGGGCDTTERVKSLVPLEDALKLIEQTVAPISTSEQVPLSAAVGRIPAEPVEALGMAAAFDNSAMDGYAIRCASLTGDGPWTLPVSGRIPAGTTGQQPFTGRGAVRIFTGAPVPSGADAVIAQEEVVREEGKITIHRSPAVGLNIRRAGAGMVRGQRILERGVRLGPREIAACAAAGCAQVSVLLPLRVSLLVTGDEVQSAGSDRHDAQIWDINTPMISAALSGAHIELVQVKRGADSREALRRMVVTMSGQSDLIITTGGISVGEEDHVKPVMHTLGAEVVFSGVAIKPGKPVSFGRLGTALWLGLPGNPLSAFVTWQVFGTAILRALLQMQGSQAAHRHVTLGKPVRRKPGRCEFRPAHFVGFDGQGREVVDFETRISSGHVAALPGADGLILLPKDTEELPEGALVEFQPFCTF